MSDMSKTAASPLSPIADDPSGQASRTSSPSSSQTLLVCSFDASWSDRVPEELWMEVRDIVQEAVIKTIPKKKKCKKAKWLSEEALQIAQKRRKVKGRGQKERYTHLNAGFQRRARRDKKALTEQCKEIEENNRIDRQKISFLFSIERKRSLQENWRYQENISCKDGHSKGQKQHGPNRSRRY